MNNIYYIVSTDDGLFSAMILKSTNQNTPPRCSLDKSQCVLELLPSIDSSPEFDNYTPISHAACVVLMQSDEWQNNTI
jgi:hypothetical protein